ncbi:MAG: hypothetical protein MUC69_05230 [Gemmatimonadales bacterium]|nr:hypothetical protein [Gemmatimonadales bacterium]
MTAPFAPLCCWSMSHPARRRAALLLALLAVPAGLAAQLPPLGVPRGTMRIEAYGDFGYATTRFRDGTREDLAADFTSDAFGPTAIPAVADASRRIGVLVGDTDYGLSLGGSVGFGRVSRTAITPGLSLGLTEGITLFGRAPLVKTDTRRDVQSTSTGDAGVNPADPTLGDAAGLASAQLFFGDFDASLDALATGLANGAYAGDPALQQLAEETLAGGSALRDSLRALVLDQPTASAYLPTGASAAGATLQGRVASVQQALSGPLGIGGFSTALPLPAATTDVEAIPSYAVNAAGPYRYASFIDTSTTSLGDVEIGAVVTPIDRWDRASLGGLRLAVEALVRLPTGTPARPDDGWPAPTGDGQLDIQLLAAADVGRGNIGARITAGYLLQLAGTFTRRVAPPGQVLVPASQRTEVSVNPGDVVLLGIAPFVRLARPLALQGGVTWRVRGDDDVRYVGTPLPGIDAGVLAQETGASTLLVSLGLSYAELAGRAGSRARVPIDAMALWESVLVSSGGRVVAGSTVRAMARVYWQLW